MKDQFRAQATAASGSFLPEDYVQRRTELRANLLSLSLFAVVLLGVVGAFLVTNRSWSSIRAEQEAINVEYTQEAAKIDQLKELERQREQMMEKAEITAALIERVPRSLLLAEIITRMPGGVTLLELDLKSKRVDPTPPPTAAGAPGSVNKATARVRSLTETAGPAAPEAPKVRAPRFDSELKIVGVAKDNEQIADYLAQLRQSPLLDRVELAFIAETTIDKSEFRKFEVTASIRPDADARQVAKPKEPAPMEPLKATAPLPSEEPLPEPDFGTGPAPGPPASSAGEAGSGEPE
jgi:Tfp pilus assembly protein PilN